MLLPMVLGITGWRLFWCKPIDAPYTKAAGVFLLLLSLTAFLTLTFDSLTVEGQSVRAGGATCHRESHLQESTCQAGGQVAHMTLDGSHAQGVDEFQRGLDGG